MNLHKCLRERAGSDSILGCSSERNLNSYGNVGEKHGHSTSRHITKTSLFPYISALDTLSFTHCYARFELSVTWLCFVASAAFVFGALILFLETVKPCWLTFGKMCESVCMFLSVCVHVMSQARIVIAASRLNISCIQWICVCDERRGFCCLF